MNFDAEKLFSLLPAFYRLQDGQLAQEMGPPHGPLQALLALLAGQIGVIEEDLEQLYDDAFIETCADWAVPYIGDLIGYRASYGVAARVANTRAEVAHTIAYRRRKGTALVLEQLARDVTGWNASVAEYFQRLVTSQYMNHLRAHIHAAPDLRDWRALERVGGGFDTIPRSVDVRSIERGRGRHNIPNVGLFLWRLDAHAVGYAPATRVDARRWRFSALNHDQALVTRPQRETDISQLATPLNVPRAIARRVLHEDQLKSLSPDPSRPVEYYSDGAQRLSLRLYVGSSEPLLGVPFKDILVSHLGDEGAGWAHLPPAGKYAIDPALGRIALPPGLPANTRVRVDYHYAFGAELGGGSYPRAQGLSAVAPSALRRVPQDFPTIQAALNALGGSGVVEITDSGRYEETLSISVAAGGRIELRAADEQRPSLVLGGAFALGGGKDSQVVLDGLLISGHRLEAAGAGNQLAGLTLRHCTLVPGRTLAADGAPVSPAEPALLADLAGLALLAERCILGALRVHAGSRARLRESIADATAPTRVAYAAVDGSGPGGPLSIEAGTVIGKIHTVQFELVSNALLLAELAGGDSWSAPVIARRRQAGCLRYSHVPADARTPARFRCVPGEDTIREPVLRFASLRYGTPAYAQLGDQSSRELTQGADDEGEMGVYNFVHKAQRLANLHLRLDEYLRAGLQAGVFDGT